MLHEVKIEGFEGSIQVELFKRSERLAAMKEMNIKFKNGVVETSDDVFSQVEKLEEISKRQIKKVNLKFDGKEYKSLDELEYFNEYETIINEIGNILLSGVKLGNV